MVSYWAKLLESFPMQMAEPACAVGALVAIWGLGSKREEPRNLVFNGQLY